MITLTPSGLRQHEIGDTTWYDNEEYNINRLNDTLLYVSGMGDTVITSPATGDTIIWDSGNGVYTNHNPFTYTTTTSTTTTTTA